MNSAQIVEFGGNHPILILSFFAILAAILYSEFSRLTQKFVQVGTAAAIQLMNNEEPVLLDVREKAELKQGSLEGAKHIPVGSLGKRISELEKYRERSILVYCRSGHRSTGACKELQKHGFERVYNLQGGILAWIDAKLPVVKK